MHSVLLIDDDDRLAELVIEYLEGRGYRVDRAATARAGEARLTERAYDVVVLDLMLPDGDGLDVCRSIRRRSSVPILMLTARGDAADRIIGLEIGADDYLPKPFDPRELAARLGAVLRRTDGGRVPDTLVLGDVEIDRSARVVRRRGAPVSLTQYQFDLLLALAQRPGRVLSRSQLTQFVRGEEAEAYSRNIDVHVSRIRAAIEEEPGRPRLLLTVRGVGYVFTGREDRR